MLLLVFIFLLLFLLEPTSPPQNVFISNITEHQATVSYTTKKPTTAGLLISKDGTFPLFSILATFIKDDGEKNTDKLGFYTTHHITISNLDPKTAYTFQIYQGLRSMYKGKFLTAETLSSVASPTPVYGKAFTAEKKPLVGAIVYLQVANGSNKSSLLSTLTNIEGGWSIDLANLRTEDGTNSFPLSPQSIETVVVEAGALGSGKASVSPGQDKPWPDILISK